ncbi:MAG TPA: hypothetical protein VNN21_05800 [Dehalococcoidia bacterium]|nr:hypothetical protein [Dehalococcoidia bacterium]
MSVRRRALLIGFLGPAIQSVGIGWEVLHVLVSHWSEPLSARHFFYEPPFLLIVVGFLVTVVCIPVSLEVVKASEEEVAIPVYGPEPVEAQPAVETSE